MHALRQKLRPKHQVLVLRCYPRTTKGAVDVKPNSSELSYLLFYASTRRSKIQKVGAFLETKTASDVWRVRIGDVQITLQILTALIEKSPRDLPLYAPFLLKILSLIQGSHDITMVEASIPTFQAFCEHNDGASLSADQEYLQQYEEIVRAYASFASTRPMPVKVQPSAPVAMRWRSVGLQAIMSVAAADALSSASGRQLNVIIPVLLENLWTDDNEYLNTIHQKAQFAERIENDKIILRRRTSVATVRTAETASETNPAALSGSAADADKIAEEDISVQSIQCLKQIFIGNNRSQVRAATLLFLKFTLDLVRKNKSVAKATIGTTEASGWAISILQMMSRWTPVQDRFVILVSTMETLVQSPVREEELGQHLTLAIMAGCLLRSDINLIGLSVMDVLLGLIQHVLRILQLGVGPHPQQRDITDASDTKGIVKEPSPRQSIGEAATVDPVSFASGRRKDLLVQLQQCIADLATHIYYADQISDMIGAILLRLKPSTNSVIATTTAAIEDPEAASTVLSSSANLSEDPNTDGFFSFATAKVTALKAIKDILLVAVNRSKIIGGASLGRNKVGVRVWEGTQWLLRDPDESVRLAYVDALVTWLERELTRADRRAYEFKSTPIKSPSRANKDAVSGGSTRRAASAASHRDKSPKLPRSRFLQLLHLAIYENALQFVDSERDIILLHLLLTTLSSKLGINAVQSGLPMIYRLQEDIQEVEAPIAKVRLGSICHGYFWSLSEVFDFDDTEMGGEIQTEITRRKQSSIWVKSIRVPATPLSQMINILDKSAMKQEEELPLSKAETEALKPFDDRSAMVEAIAVSYGQSVVSPQTSPVTSPNRSFSQPILAAAGLMGPPPLPPQAGLPDRKLPERIREQMLAEWSREEAAAALYAGGQVAGSKTASLNGSRTGTHVTAGGHNQQQRNFLAVNGTLHHGNGGSSSNGNGGAYSPLQAPSHRSRPTSQAYGLVGGGIGALAKIRKDSTPEGFGGGGGGGGNGGSPTPGGSGSSRNSVARVEHLKRVLSGQAPPTGSAGHHAAGGGLGGGGGLAPDNSSTESMLSYDAPASELSFALPHLGATGAAVDLARRGSSSAAAAAAQAEAQTETERQPEEGVRSSNNDDGEASLVPPVPPIPASHSRAGSARRTSEAPAQDVAAADAEGGGGGGGAREGSPGARRSSRGQRERHSVLLGGKSWGFAAKQKSSEAAAAGGGTGEEQAVMAADLATLLKGIGADVHGDATKGLAGLAKPPY